MKATAIGFLLVVAICLVAVLDKEWNFVRPGLWLLPTPVSTRPTTTTAKATVTSVKTTRPMSHKATPAKQKVTYPIDVPY